MDNLIALLGFEPPYEVMPVMPKEEDLEEDSEEVESTRGSEDFNDSMVSDRPEYHQDLKDFGPLDG